MNEISRRKALSLLGVGGAVSLAGCNTDSIFSGSSEVDVTNRVEVTTKLAPNPDSGRGFLVIVSDDLLDGSTLDLTRGHQIRVQTTENPSSWRQDSFLSTVRPLSADNTEEKTQTIWLTNRGFDRLGIEPGNSVTLRPFVSAQSFDSRTEAEEADEILEQWTDNNSRQLFIAPHGGEIFENTGEQVFRGVSEHGYDAWTLFGYSGSSEEALRRWYVPTDLMNPNSFVGFRDRFSLSYQTVVSFQGSHMSMDSDIIVGGLASETIKGRIVDNLQEYFSDDGDGDSNVTVESRVSGDHSESDPANIVNQLSRDDRNGISITQSSFIRRQYWRPVSEIVAETVQNR